MIDGSGTEARLPVGAPDVPIDPTCDVVVVGAGPAGIAAAIHLHWMGLAVQVFDKAEFPRDKCCGDGLTALALRELETLQFHPETVADWRPLDGATLVAPDRSRVRIPLPLPDRGYYGAVAPRYQLDAALVAHARSLGIAVFDGWGFDSVSQERELVDIGFRSGSAPSAATGVARVSTRYVIAADGAWSPIRKAVDATIDGYRGDWQAMRQYVTGVTGPARDEMFIWFEPDLLPGYAWSFPLPNGRANFGFGVLRSQRRTGAEVAALWDALWQRSHIRGRFGNEATREGRVAAWPIPARVDAVPLTDHRVLFVGDAAAATDVLTGEGIGQALLTGRLAAEAVRVGGSDDAHRVTAHYQRSVRHELFADHRMSQRLSATLSTERGAQNSLDIVARSGDWGRRNFARWLFEDEPRSILLTPRRWHRRFLDRDGAYRRYGAGAWAPFEPVDSEQRAAR